ncbi:hypothetical protein ATE84_2938 [Aquimarina sp. MAR_2010_214]|uniref:hypothetical protein n=1 Tax=Aquimarina sp. MAR_2010_214 TaxID=1250026 RepID=UPI000C7089D3|nr:hypothetical protein [Aquimarina sp. MAR_2010_214]PKV50870.1 hypothetical protein ATE84_2938 [Aquimarina sp. MAR_2010_214]
MDMKKKVEKAFEFAASQVKQLITISSAILVLTITFTEKIITVCSVNDFQRTLIITGWILYLLAIIFGVFALGALSGSLQKIANDKLDVYAKNIRGPMLIQFLSFILAIITTMILGSSSI